MRGRRLATALLVVWTLAMAAWLVLYREAQATCGPEIYRSCQIGLKITPGLGRPGIVLLWSLGVVAFALTWLTTRRPGSAAIDRAVRRFRGLRLAAPAVPALGSSNDSLRRRPLASLRGTATLAAFLLLVAVVGSLVASRGTQAPVQTDQARVDVVSAVVQPAATPSGRRRKRARVTVQLRLANQGESTIANVQPALLARTRVNPDPRADDTTGSLLEPIPPGSTAAGALRFETAAAVTDRLLATRRAQLRIAGETVPLTLSLRPPPEPGPESRPPVPVEEVRVDVVSAVVQPAATPSGRRRKRARVTVQLRLANQGESTIANVQPALLARTRVNPDPRADDTTGSLLEPIPPGSTAAGALRFETAAAVTDRLLATRRAQLRIAGETVPLTLSLRPSPNPGQRRARCPDRAAGGREEATMSDPFGVGSAPTFAWC